MGGSIAGLLAARVLTDHFDRVTLIERDRLPDEARQRKGVPQGRHVHTLLSKGWQIIKHYFPDIDAPGEDGITPVDWPQALCWYHYGGYKPRIESGIYAVMASRPYVEWQIRRRVLGLEGVTVLQECRVQDLVASPDCGRITGVRVQRKGEAEAVLSADLVVDATGRGSRSPKWLEALGYERPDEHMIQIDFMYTSRIYRRVPGALGGAKAAYMLPAPPHGGKRAGALCSIENDAWLVTLGGWLGEPAPQDEAEFLDFARTLPAQDLYHAIKDAEPLTDLAIHKFPSNLRRRYETMKRFPEGYVVLGDALCSVNPVYGQGMTSSALAAATLDRCLTEHRQRSLGTGLPKRFFRQVAREIDRPWRLAACEDFRYPEVRGVKMRGTDAVNWYMKKVHQAALHDPAVYRAFIYVMHLLKSPVTLFHPRMALRVLRARLAQRRAGRGRRVHSPAQLASASG